MGIDPMEAERRPGLLREELRRRKRRPSMPGLDRATLLKAWGEAQAEARDAAVLRTASLKSWAETQPDAGDLLALFRDE
jgi:hypothetical protein